MKKYRFSRIKRDLENEKHIVFRYIRYIFTVGTAALIFLFCFMMVAGTPAENDLLAAKLPFYITILSVIIWELSFWWKRRRNGFTYLGSYDKNIKRLKENGQLLDDLGNVIDGEDNGNNKNDEKNLDYWFGLFEKGAISEKEYEVKKAELL